MTKPKIGRKSVSSTPMAALPNSWGNKDLHLFCCKHHLCMIILLGLITRPVRLGLFADKLWLKVLLAGLVCEKNIIRWLINYGL